MAQEPRVFEPFASALFGGARVFDGAMGTELYARGVPPAACLELLTVERPALVSEVHAAYLDAGAEVLVTHSFGANRLRLAGHGLAARAAELNRAAVRVARQASAGRAWVVGSVGPTGLRWQDASEELRDAAQSAIEEACRALVDEGVDALLLETFRHPGELWRAIEAALRASGGSVPVLASASFDRHATLVDGTGPEALARELRARGAAALGVNCAEGPESVLAVVPRMAVAGLPVVARPSAGLPRRDAGRIEYPVDPEAFGSYAQRLYAAGALAVGGCCGTTPAHVRAVAVAARGLCSAEADTPHAGRPAGAAARVAFGERQS